MHRLSAALAAGCVAFAAAPVSIASDAGPAGEDIVERADAVREATSSSSRSLVVLPIPQSSPTLGTGLVLSAVLFYQPENSAGPWMTGGGALWTDNGSRGAGVFHKGDLQDDRYRFLMFAAGADLRLNFYGVGGDGGLSIPIEQRGRALQFDGYRRIAANTYLGLRVRGVDIETVLRLAPPLSRPDLEIPPLQRESRIAGPGLLFQYDTRDNAQAPRTGLYATAELQWNNAAFGSDFAYSKLQADLGAYRTMSERAVLALRVAACRVGGDAPFYDLCLFGAGSDLRGYEAGKYRDRSLLATQAELRWQWTPRWGWVAFAGVGAVADGFGDLPEARALPSAGVGLRFRASRKYPVNVRFDYARGRGEDAVYFSIGEAF